MIEIIDLCKSFDTGSYTVDALSDINITIEDGDIYGIIGMSGAGKSTLVRCINMLEKPTSGRVIVNGKEMGLLSDAQLRAARREISMIFQQFNLLKQRNCLQNICFPMELNGVPKAQREKRAMELLELVGLPDKAKAFPSQLSGGQQQRVAIARALATDPKVLLCDEATSALDPKTTAQILDLIKEINKKMGITCVIITHQMSVVEDCCNKVAILDNGVVAEKGFVSDVFAAPQSDAGKRLVYSGLPEPKLVDMKEYRNVRVVFTNADMTGRPLIATMASELGIVANIIAADIHRIEGNVIGTMLLGISENDFDKAMKYISSIEGLKAEEVKQLVQ